MSDHSTNTAIAPMPWCPVCANLEEVCAPDARAVVEAERRVVEWLREQGGDTGYLTAGQSAIRQVADAIERGEHRG